ncbi:MAG: Ig-like domain-containing protein, partial [Methanobacteriaceae archaeon]|nr:Ig-like domain-containing protein [Methanobacteriaceae archaeon]
MKSIVIIILIVFMTIGIATATNTTDDTTKDQINSVNTNDNIINSDNTDNTKDTIKSSATSSNFNNTNINTNSDNNIDTTKNSITKENSNTTDNKINTIKETGSSNNESQISIKSESNTQLATHSSLNKINTTLGNKVVLTATFVDSNYKYLTSGKVAFKINGKTIGYANIINGKATLTYSTSSLTQGTYTITATYGGTNTQEKSTATNKMILTKDTTHSSIDQVVASVTNRVSFKATFVDSNYKYLTSGKVAFKINGKTIGYANIINGKATLTYSTSSLTQGTYTITATYGGTNTQEKSTATNKMILTKDTTHSSIDQVVASVTNRVSF